MICGAAASESHLSNLDDTQPLIETAQSNSEVQTNAKNQ
jgi:hypothetical protein